MRSWRSAFTLVEILIVVVILGILAAIVVPQFSKAVMQSSETATYDQLAKIRRALAYYYATNDSQYPTLAPGIGTWGPLMPAYMRTPPENSWVGTGNSRVIILGTGPDTAYQTNYAWIYDQALGEVWAGGFDGTDNPLPRP